MSVEKNSLKNKKLK
uniref:Uncharacterized protein n=1 Tax=Anguilla anguilla TaxID=7936 RepID=A0A0E9R209_ANGAN